MEDAIKNKGEETTTPTDTPTEGGDQPAEGTTDGQ